mmetsp:Transcript_14558/g.20979  ORF Transcript_14558/g.20979 Transcript_14558/m.20979 type:complete len:183 (+) Transcript_14558:357-905(+)
MRIWRLQRLDVEVAETMRARSSKKDAEMDDVDEEDFMQEVEADKEMRKNMNLYKNSGKKKEDGDEPMGDGEADQQAVVSQDNDDEANDGDEDDDQEVKLDELLEGLVLDKPPDTEDVTNNMTDEEAWAMAVNAQQEGEKAAKDGINFIGRDHAKQVPDKDSAVPVSSNEFSKQFTNAKFSFT